MKKKTKQKYEVTANKANIPEQYLQEVIFPDIISNIWSLLWRFSSDPWGLGRCWLATLLVCSRIANVISLAVSKKIPKYCSDKKTLHLKNLHPTVILSKLLQIVG